VFSPKGPDIHGNTPGRLVHESRTISAIYVFAVARRRDHVELKVAHTFFWRVCSTNTAVWCGTGPCLAGSGLSRAPFPCGIVTIRRPRRLFSNPHTALSTLSAVIEPGRTTHLEALPNRVLIVSPRHKAAYWP